MYVGIDDSAGANFTGTAYGRFIYSSGAYPLSFIVNAAERMRITSAGNVGIGTTTPAAPLDISNSSVATAILNSSNANGGYVIFRRNGTDYGYIGNAYHLVVGGSNTDIAVAGTTNIVFSSGSSLNERMRITSAGQIAIPYTTLAVTGNTSLYWNNSNGNLGVLTSARRFKKDIISLTKEQAEIALALNPVEYTRLETNEKEFGFIAEEVKEAGLGFFVPEIDGEPLTVDYARLSVIAIAMIKEQQTQINELKALINA
jgi:hypothetical protein